MATKSRFSLLISAAGPNAKPEEISKLQAYLRRFGYVNEDVKQGEMDPPTEAALKNFQAHSALPVTGVLDGRTVDLIESPRCANLDSADVTPASFVVYGCSYEKVTLTYRFVNDTPDLPPAVARAAVRAAFQTWADALCGVEFVEVASGSSDLTIGWFAGDHGDGFPFDGPGNVIAHAFYPPCSGGGPMPMHFDEAEQWSTSGAGLDLETVALHEIGHLLGLAHSSEPDAVMYAFYSGVRRDLDADDISGIRSLYPWLCRRGDSGSQGGATLEIDSTRGSTAAQLVAVDRATSGRLRLTSWRVDPNAIVKTGDSGTAAGSASLVRVARMPGTDRYVTACRGVDGNLKLITWAVTQAGAISRVGDSGSVGGPASLVSVTAVDANTIATAVRDASNLLHIQSWRLQANDSITLLDEDRSVSTIDEVAVQALADGRVVTASRSPSSFTLGVVAWHVDVATGVITRTDSLGAAGTCSRISLSVDTHGHAVTSVRRSSAGNVLRLTTWEVDSSGDLAVLDTIDGEAVTEDDVAAAFDHVVSAVRTTGGDLKIIAWSTNAGGEIERVGDSAFLAGAADTVSVAGGAVDAVSFIRASNGTLKAIAWSPPV